MDDSAEYADAISFLESLPQKKEWTLNPVSDLCGGLGFDPKKVPCMLITGTNGKGSVAALCESAIRAAGHSTGRYISPHLVDYTERVSINGQDISKEEFGKITLAARTAVEGYNESHGEKLSLFEVNTAVALKHFLDKTVDFAVIETGMGGRLDSTNITAPVVSVITRVSLDHVQALGDTVEKIALEKAGILRPGRPVITGCTGTALEVIEKQADKTGSKVIRVAESEDDEYSFRPIEVTTQRTTVDVSTGLGTTRLSTSLLGRHQCLNMAVAYAALAELDRAGALNIPETAIRTGFLSARWPGRIEIVSEAPLVVLDGAHNQDGANALAESIPLLFPGKKVFLVCGMMDDKDVEAAVAEIAPPATAFYATAVAYHRTASARRVADAARKHCNDVTECKDVKTALQAAVGRAKAEPGSMVLVAGSLYLVGEVKQILREGSDGHS